MLSVFSGAFAVFVFKPQQKAVRLLLSFSGAYLLAITILHLLPEVFVNTHGASRNHNHNQIGIFILLGIFIQFVLESFSKGVEHGHIHAHSHSNAFPWMLLISLCIHAFTEGIPIGYAKNDNLMWAICVHKIPISIVLATFLFSSKMSKIKSLFFLTIFAAMSPLGALLATKVPLFVENIQEISAVSTGILLHISTIILYESAENHKFNYTKFIAIIAGLVVALFASF